MKSYLQKHNKIKYSDHWSTPREIYDKYIYYLDYYDPCQLHHQDTSLDINCLECITWVDRPMFINPPYSDITSWIDWAIENHKKYGKHIVLLIPSRTDTRYFHKLLNYGVDLEFIKGRLKFGDSKNSAPFPSVLVHINQRVKNEDKEC